MVSTPIGNLADLTERARTVLAAADLIACEDTRRTGALLHHLGLKRRLVSLHEHNERRRIPALLDEIEAGAAVALVSDAGTPLLSDPGYLLVREAVARGVPVIPVPGASAALAALVVSGFPPYPFTFAGFAPPKSGRRRRFFEELARLGHTVVVFESPHRIARSLDDAIAVFGPAHPAALGRELTKLHEEVLRGSLEELRDRLGQRAAVKGELVLVLAPEAPPSGAVGAEEAV
ncbi:MAG TPA: 16S rRNA (cytidine(1402)-2'-O)-methyltransferase [Thermoanaerobaculia bacterium]|nr:16S rRNA (cytidine(1402)-2'-O)-methyltransferase [Thermoanaerobaculia bacterium]